MKRRSAQYAISLLVIVILAIIPIFPDTTSSFINWLTTVFILAVLGLSFDLLLGYSGIVSFGHALYFGIGGYTVAIMLTKENTIINLIAGLLIACLLGVASSVGIGYLSLRVKSTYFAMITLAFAELAYVISRSHGLRTWLQGDDGMNISLPDGFDSHVVYWIAGAMILLTFLFLKRAVHSPWGKVLVAVRDNEVRTASQGYSVLRMKLTSMGISGGIAAISGGLYAIAQAFVNPDAVFGLDKSLDPLLMVMIGGAGTLYGPMLGAVVIYGAQQVLTSYTQQVPFLEHWMILFGILYILIVLFLPKGILGTYRKPGQGEIQTDTQSKSGSVPS